MEPQAEHRRVAGMPDGRVRWCVLPLVAGGLVTACTRSHRGERDDVGETRTTSIVIAVDAGAQASAADAEDAAVLARDLRSALAADDTLSARARAIEVLVDGGRITLRGRVTNPREHDDVLGKARRLGAASIVDELTISETRRRASPAAPGR